MSGFVMALYLAGLRGVSDELREAGRMDGASESAHLPPHHPAAAAARSRSAPIVLLGYVSLKMFDLVFVLTKGGPALTSDLPSIFMFETTFRSQLVRPGRGSGDGHVPRVRGPDRAVHPVPAADALEP